MINEVTIKVDLDSALLLLWVLRTRADVYNEFHRYKGWLQWEKAKEDVKYVVFGLSAES